MSELTPYLRSIGYLMDQGYLRKALTELQNLMKEYPEDEELASLLGECYLAMGQPEKAIRPLRWAAKRDESLHPEEPSPHLWIDHYLLGSAYSRCAKFQPAMRHFDIANDLEPNNAEVIRNMGWVRCMQGNSSHGRALLMRAINLDPRNALAYNDLGASFMFEEQFSIARKWIEKARSLDPSDRFIQNTSERLDELEALKILAKTRSSD